jgi:hypothetical protein
MQTSGEWRRENADVRLYRHCEERSDEAIHFSVRREMDCFAPLAMTVLLFEAGLGPVIWGSICYFGS